MADRQGDFKGLSAKIDALEMRGGSKDGVRVGTVIVSFNNCETAVFEFVPVDGSLTAQSRTIHVDPGTWKYCK